MENIQILFNGQKESIQQQSLATLLQHHNINISYIAIALNNTVIPVQEIESTLLKDGDALEIVYAISGG